MYLMFIRLVENIVLYILENNVKIFMILRIIKNYYIIIK